MWFEVIVDFVTDLFPIIQNTALEIMTWLTEPISVVGIETQFVPYEIMFGVSLFTILTYSLVKFILDIWPG